MIYITILVIFIYFKIARVHKKEEKLTSFWKVQHFIVFTLSLLTYIYAFNHVTWYVLFLVSLISFVLAAMLITAVQLGIFVDGKPLFGMHTVYKNTYYLTVLLCFLSVMVWLT
jgi:hypothetical protein